MFLLDTNIISELMITPPHNPNANVDAWIDEQIVETLFISSITVAEIAFGIEILAKGKKKENLTSEFENYVLHFFENRILSFDKNSARAFALLTAKARKQGLTIGLADAYIGAIAHSNKLTVATRDTSPFEAMGLKVINPFD